MRRDQGHGLRQDIKGLTFHDLRSAVVGLALAESRVAQNATITSHSLKDVASILEAHFLGRDIQLAEMTIEKRTKL